MNTHVRPDQLRFTFEEYLAFLEDRPDAEKWELLDGQFVMSPAPNTVHQRIVRNLTSMLDRLSSDLGAEREVLPGANVHVPAAGDNAPQPDVIVLPKIPIDVTFTDQPLVVFEVLSKGSRQRDLTLKRRIYGAMPTITDYVVIAQDRVALTHFSRAGGWKAKTIESVDAVLPLSALGADLPVRGVYRGTGLAG